MTGDSPMSLETALTRARQLTISSLEENPDGPGLRVKFAGNLFDDGGRP